MFGAGHGAWVSSRLHGHRLGQQYPCWRPVVPTAGACLNDCKVSETVSSRADGDRQHNPALPPFKYRSRVTPEGRYRQSR